MLDSLFVPSLAHRPLSAYLLSLSCSSIYLLQGSVAEKGESIIFGQSKYINPTIGLSVQVLRLGFVTSSSSPLAPDGPRCSTFITVLQHSSIDPLQSTSFAPPPIRTKDYLLPNVPYLLYHP